MGARWQAYRRRRAERAERLAAIREIEAENDAYLAKISLSPEESARMMARIDANAAAAWERLVQRKLAERRERLAQHADDHEHK